MTYDSPSPERLLAEQILKQLETLRSPRHAMMCMALLHASIIASHSASQEGVERMLAQYVDTVRMLVKVSALPDVDN